MNLKKLLKNIKSAEEPLSSLMGILVVVAVAFLIFKYFQGLGKSLPSLTDPEEIQEESGIKPGQKTHQVSQGENLWTVALKYYNSGYSWVDIARENNLKDANIIFVGQTLVIPDVSPKAVADQTTLVPDDKYSPITQNEYLVAKSDNLWNIAVRAYGDGFQWTKIAQANKLVNPNLIHPGNNLVIPR